MYPREVGQGWILYFDEGRGLPYIANAQKNLTYWTELDLDDGWCIRQDELDDDAVYLNVLTDQVTFDRPPKRHATMVPRQPEVSHQTSTTSSNKTNNLSWFEYFLKATNTEHLKQMLMNEECTTCDTLSLVTEQGLKELGIRMGARVRILQFLEQQNDNVYRFPQLSISNVRSRVGARQIHLGAGDFDPISTNTDQLVVPLVETCCVRHPDVICDVPAPIG